MSNLLKSKFLMGVMIVAFLVVGVMAVMPVTKANADCSITSTLKQGMKSTQVLCLQQKLNVTPATSYFGTITKAAVMAFQKANSLTADGVVGPLTRAAILGGTPVSQGSCPAGYVATTPVAPTFAACVVATPAQGSCPAGYVTVAPVAPTFATCALGTGTIGTTNGTNGALVASQSSAVSYGVTINAGATANLAAIKLQATSGPVQVTSVDVHMNVRPWLYFSQVTLSSNGTVLATLPLTSANATEITVGSDYLLNFSGLNYTVTPGTNPDLIVAGTSISGTNRLPQLIDTVLGNIKTVNGSGWTDSVGPTNAPVLHNYGVGMNEVNLSANGSVAEVYANLSNVSPATSQVSISQSTGSTTSNVLLGVFSLKSTNTSATINGLTFGLNDSNGSALSTLSNVRVVGPGCTGGCGGLLTYANYTANGVTSANNTVTFTNLTSPISQDAWTDFTVEADVAGASTGTIYMTLAPAYISGANTVATGYVVGTDSNYDNLTFGTTSTIQSNSLTLTSSAVTLSNVTFATTSTINGGSNGQISGYNTALTFTLTNNGNNNVYVSTTPAVAYIAGGAVPTTAIVAYTTGGTATAGSSTVGTIVNTVSPSTEPQDSLTVAPVGYEIPINGSRTFTIDGVLKGAAGQATMTIGGINYEITQGGAGTAIVSNILPVSVSGSF
jgi:peptidoglycan hydrolase-like protein with peptidoglycan-binding domain